MSLTLNGQDVKSATIYIPYKGAWVGDFAMGGDNLALAPSSGPAILLIGASTYRGTIDPRATGTFVSNATVRVVGGGGGWDKEVPAQDFYTPATLPSTVVYSATAALVLETVLDPTPLTLPRFSRTKGPASRVFGDRQWYVDLTTGITTVADWLPAVFDGVIVNYDPTAGTVTLHSESLILPGTVLVDDRFNGKTYTVRDVEQVFDESGCTATAWVCEETVSRLEQALTGMVREFASTQYLKTYLYRFVLGDAQSLALQAITDGAPDLNPITQWSGLSGAAAKLMPGTEIVVGFVGGNAETPYLVSFSSLATPLGIDLAGGADFVALSAKVDAIFNSLQTIFTAWVPVPLDGGAALKALLSGWTVAPTGAALVKAT